MCIYVCEFRCNITKNTSRTSEIVIFSFIFYWNAFSNICLATVLTVFSVCVLWKATTKFLNVLEMKFILAKSICPLLVFIKIVSFCECEGNLSVLTKTKRENLAQR